MLQISSTTIWRWIQAGKLQAYRVGDRNIRIKKEALEAVIRPAVAQPKETTSDKVEYKPEPVSEEELARRQTVVADILALRQECKIAPMTTTDLIRKARKEEMKARDRACRSVRD